jgi:1,4-alpha-glucan branching enzyme
MKLRRLLPLFCTGLVIAATAFAQSSRGGMGAVPYADSNGTGVTFRTWAPNASSVNVRGSFNGWGTTAMAADPSGGTWSVDVPRARAGDQYKFDLNGSWRKDPRGKRVVNSAGNSIVYDPNAFDWAGHSFGGIWRNDLVIYQMHVGTYNAESWLPSTFDQALEKLDHIKSMGFSAVKLMPVNEFPGDRSWGYNPSDPYAIESAFGGPDGLKRFVKTCHENGIAVLIDVVHNHYGPSDLEMWQYDGWSQNGLGGIYFYNDWKAHTDWGSTRPDYGRAEVRDYIKGQIRMFLEDYKVDGFRWDSVYNIRNASGSWNQIGSDMLWDINQMMINEFPNAFRIAEDHAFDTDVGFEAQWDHGFLNDIRWLATAPSDSDRNMDTLAHYLSNGGFNWVRYAESHDSCGDLNNKHRLPRDIDSANPQGYWAKKRALLAHTIALVSPGIPMIFAGSEMHEDWTFSNNTALRWSLTNQNAGIVRAFADLIHLRRNFHGNTSGLKQPGKASVHHVDHTAKVVGVIRWDQGGQTDDLVIVLNASAIPRTGYSMPFPSAGTWYCLYNSDSTAYDAGFGGDGPAVGGSVSVSGTTASLDLGAYSMQIYSKTPIPQESAAAFDPPAPSGCGTTVRITYTPGEGPLDTAAEVYAFIGRNDWQNSANHLMTADGDTWTLDYVIPDLTYELNLTFTDGIDAWDNNGGLNWAVPVSNCGDLPSEAVWSPYMPQGCVALPITYHPNGGPLMGATNVTLFIGRNSWNNIVELPMTQMGENEWTLLYSIPDDTWELNFVFYTQTEGGTTWDNNNTRNWRARVSDCAIIDQPFVAITNPAPATSVSGTVAAVDLNGAASLLTGHLRWTNQLNGASGQFAYSTNWQLPSVPLAEGVNVIRVSGTNSHVNPNHGAWDSPTNAAYNSVWTNGSNGGASSSPGSTAAAPASPPATEPRAASSPSAPRLGPAGLRRRLHRGHPPLRRRPASRRRRLLRL